MQLIFGPVNSRRFGSSLGVDLSPQTKQCNFDCLYCELAPAQPLQQQKYVISVDEVIDKLKKHLKQVVDVITITANGEPTLYPHLEELIKRIDILKGETKTLILSNSATLTDEKTFKTLLCFDKVKLSLDAVRKGTFKKIDRPVKSIDIDAVVHKLIEFSKEYTKELYIEVLFIKGINDSMEEIEAISDVLVKLSNLTRVDIGTIDRPPAYPVEGLTYDELYKVAQMFDSFLPIHIASRNAVANVVKQYYSEDEIENTLDKRPLTREDIDILFDKESLAKFEKMLESGRIKSKRVGSLVFYVNGR